MFLFFDTQKKKKIDNYKLIVDIGTESIGASFVLIKNNEKPHIIQTIRHQIPFQDKVSVKRLIMLVKETLGIVLEDLEKKGKNIKPEEVLVTLASPWCTSQTRIIDIVEENDFEITEDLLLNLVSKEEKIYLDQIIENNQLESSNLKVIESNIISIKVNGYKIEKPIGIKTRNLSLSINITSSQSLIIETIKNTLSKRWNGINFIFKSFIFSSFSVIKDRLSKEKSFLIVNVSGEVTDISLVIDNILISSISFPYGFNAFLRSISKELSIQSEVAYSEMHLYRLNKLNKDRLEQISSILDETANKWSSILKTSIKQLTKYKIIPKYIYLISSNDYLNILEKSIKSIENEVLGENTDGLKVVKLNEPLLLNFVSQENKECEDLFIYVTIIMLEKLIDIESELKNNLISKK